MGHADHGPFMDLATHGAGWWWWLLFFAFNWTIAAAYFRIPIRMAEQRRRGERRAESLLFEMFIAACGLHHLMMPVLMLFSNGLWALFVMLCLDAAVAGISWMASSALAAHGARGDDG